jgi:hypothetical protein
VLIGAARAAFGVGESQPAEPPLGKGAFLVLQSAGGALASSERHELAE